MTSGFRGHYFTPHSWLRQSKQEVLISADAVRWQVTAQDCARPMPFNHATILASVGFSTESGPAALIMAEGKGNRRQRRSLYLCAQAKLTQLTTNLNKKAITAIATARFYMVKDGHRKPSQLVVIGLQDGSLRAFYLDLDTMTIPTKTCAFAVNTAPITAIDCSAIQDSEVTCDRGPRVLNKIVALSANSGAYILNINATPTGRINLSPLSDISSLVRSRVPPQVVASAGQPSAGSILVAVPRISSYRTPRVHVILLRHGKRILLAKVRPSSSNVKWSGVNAIKLFKPDAESSACQLVAVFTGTTKDQAEAKFFELSTWSIDHQVVTYQATHDISSRLTSTSNVLDLHPSADEGTGFEILDSQQFDREGFVGVDTESLIPPDTLFESDIESEIDSDTEHAAGEFPDAIRPEDLDQMLSSPSTDNGSARQSSISPQRDHFQDNESESESGYDSSTQPDAHSFPLRRKGSDLDAMSDRSNSVEPWSELTEDGPPDIPYPDQSVLDRSMSDVDSISEAEQNAGEGPQQAQPIGSSVAEEHALEPVAESTSPSASTSCTAQSAAAAPEEPAETSVIPNLATEATESMSQELPAASLETSAYQTEELGMQQNSVLNNRDVIEYTRAQISIPVPVYDILDESNTQNTGDHVDTTETGHLNHSPSSTRASSLSRIPLTTLPHGNKRDILSSPRSADKRKPAEDDPFSGPGSVKRRKSAEEAATSPPQEADPPQNNGVVSGSSGEQIAEIHYDDFIHVEGDPTTIYEFTQADMGPITDLNYIPADAFEDPGSFDMDISEDHTPDVEHNTSRETVFTSYESLLQEDAGKADTTAAGSDPGEYCSSDDGYQTPDALNDDETEASYCDALQDFEDTPIDDDDKEKESLTEGAATSVADEGTELHSPALAASVEVNTFEGQTISENPFRIPELVDDGQQHQSGQVTTYTPLAHNADKVEEDTIPKSPSPCEPAQNDGPSPSGTEELPQATLISDSALTFDGKSPSPSPERPTYEEGRFEEPLTPMEPEIRDNDPGQSNEEIPLKNHASQADSQDREESAFSAPEWKRDHDIRANGLPSKFYPDYHTVLQEAIEKERNQSDTPIAYPTSILYLENRSASNTYYGPSRNKEQMYAFLDAVFQGPNTNNEVLNDTAHHAAFTDEELGFILAYVIEQPEPMADAFGIYLFARNGRLKLSLYLYLVTRHEEVRLRCADMAAWTASTIFDFSPSLCKDDVLRMTYALVV